MERFLYHGTSEKSWNEILSHGAIIPRGKSRKNNWKHTAAAHPKAVYLTNCYAPYFAVSSAELLKIKPARAAVIEIKVSNIISNLTMDEDVIEQSTRIGPVTTREMLRRTARARAQMLGMRGTNSWQQSLNLMGTCAHIGEIAVANITRVALVDVKEHQEWTWEALDPLITIKNYLYCCDKYKSLTQMAFKIGEVIKL